MTPDDLTATASPALELKVHSPMLYLSTRVLGLELRSSGMHGKPSND